MYTSLKIFKMQRNFLKIKYVYLKICDFFFPKKIFIEVVYKLQVYNIVSHNFFWPRCSLGAQNLNHWTTREVPVSHNF